MPEHILDYLLERNETVRIVMPVGAQVLCVKARRDLPYIWAKSKIFEPPKVEEGEEEPTEPVETRLFLTVGTGQPLPDDARIYVGTIQIRGGASIYHVFELVNEKGGAADAEA